MEELNCRLKRVFYYEVNGKKFYNEIEAKEYALKLFLTEEITKLWKKNNYYSNYSCYLDEDDKTIVVYIYYEPEVYDDWNVGHYGCTSPKMIDRSRTYKFKTIGDFYKSYSEHVKEIFKIDESINIEHLKPLCTEEVIDNMLLYKHMTQQLKSVLDVK